MRWNPILFQSFFSCICLFAERKFLKMNAVDDRPVLLAIDDTPQNLHVLNGLLHPHYRLRVATSAETGIKMAMAKTPDLILLDIMMPDIDGYEVCRRLKENEATHDVPIIFVTAMSDLDDEVKGFNLGAVDYVTKPISGPILLARVATHLSLVKARKALQQQSQLLQDEIDLTTDILLRMRNDERFSGAHLRYFSEPEGRASGDLVMSAFAPNGCQYLFLGDFTGHGLPGAIAGPLVQHIFYSMTADGKSADSLLVELNNVLYARLPTRIFLAACLVEIVPDRSRFSYWNAGLPDGMLSRADGEWLMLPSNHIVLGVTEMEQAVGDEWQVAPSDRLYLMSDGVTEVAMPGGEHFGVERLRLAIDEMDGDSRSLNSILHQLERFAQGKVCDQDDTTLLECCFA
jgi:CheY-like chemotaxis protein